MRFWLRYTMGRAAPQQATLAGFARERPFALRLAPRSFALKPPHPLYMDGTDLTIPQYPAHDQNRETLRGPVHGAGNTGEVRPFSWQATLHSQLVSRVLFRAALPWGAQVPG